MADDVYPRRLSGKRTRYLKLFEVGQRGLEGSWWSRLFGRRPRRNLEAVSGEGSLGCPSELDLDRPALQEIKEALSGYTDAQLDESMFPRRADPYGICLSGGGIRSASYCLGVLQEMSRHGMLHVSPNRSAGESDQAADYIASVSGGSYMAASFAMLNRGEYPGEPSDVSDLRSGSKPPVTPGSLPAFAPMSPEECYLRDHTRYLTHGFGGILGVIWRLIAGISWNVLILSLVIGLFAVPIGWIYGAVVPSLRASCGGTCQPHHFDFPTWIYGLAIGLALLGLVLAMAWVSHQWKMEGTRRVLAIGSLACVGLAALWLLSVIVIPLLLEWIRASVGVHTANHQIPPDNSTEAIGAVSGASTLASALTAIFGVRALRTAESAWSKVPSGDKQALLTRLKSFLLKSRVTLLNLLAALTAPMTIAAIAVLGLHIGSLYRPFVLGWTGWSAFLGWLGGTAVVLVVWRFGDLNSWSMHYFYRERLSAAFGLKRFEACDEVWSPTSALEGGRLVDATRRPYDFVYKISESQPELFPELLVCAAANVSKYGATPTKAPVTSFVFSKREIGGPVIGAWPSTTYEGILSMMKTLERNMSLPAAVAMSGAAISPEMGRMTRAPLRFLLTMLNVRLGLWIPNPNRLAEFAVRATKRSRGRLRPRITYLFREMFGKNNPESKFLYVTDGGHYENLGLVELLRRRCRYIWCLDASGEQQDGFSTIAGATALAFNELGCRIEIDPAGDMGPVPLVTKQRAALGLKPVVKRTFSVGTIFYDPQDPTDIGRLVAIKTGVPEDAPEGVTDFYQNDKKSFPCDTTLDQLYTSDRFDAYRSLGAFAASQALTYCWNDFQQYLKAGRPPARFY
jgi:hypothetical protein